MRANFFMRYFLPLSIVFFVALTASVVHNFYGSNTKTIYFADSRNYLTTTGYYCSFFLDTLKGKPPTGLIKDESLKQKLICDGPVLSGVFGAFFALIGRVPGPDDWKTIVFIQSLFHALTASLVVCLTWSVLHRRRFALLAGMAFALYPPALITAGRFMTETLGCFFVTAFLVTLFVACRKPILGLVSGFLAGSAFTTKVLLAPPVVLTSAAALLANGVKLRALMALLTGFVVAVGTWVFFSHNYLGRAMITTERAAVHNAFIGWDNETDGFQASSPTTKEKIFLSSTPISVIWGQIASDPVSSLVLVAKKLTRIYGYPFNDFRHGSFGLSSLHIIGIHWLYLFFFIAGIVMYAAGGFSIFLPIERQRINLALLFLLSMQGCFLVEGSARYGVAALPFFALFSSVACLIATKWWHAKDFKPITIYGAAAAALSALVVLAEPLVSNQPSNNDVVNLQHGKPVTAIIELKVSKPATLREHALIIVDGDKGLQDCNVVVNGHALPDAPVSLALLDSRRYSKFNVMKDYGYGLGANIDDLRQWRAVTVPTSYLQLNGPNKILIEPKRDSAQIYINNSSKEMLYRDLDIVSVNRLLNTPTGYEARTLSAIRSARTKKAFLWVSPRSSQGATTASAVQPLQIYIGLLPEDGSNSAPLKTAQKKNQKLVHDFTQSDFPLLTRVDGTNELVVSKYVVSHSFTHASVPLPDYSDFTHIRVKFTGDVRSTSDKGRAGIAVSTGPRDDSAWFLARLPYFIAASKQWRNFEISDIVPCRIYRDRISMVNVGLYPGPWPEVAGVGPSVAGPPIFLRNLKLEVEPFDSVDVQGKNILMN